MPTRRKDGRTRQAGVTLVELLVSMIVLAIVSTMLVAGWINLQRASATAVHTNNSRAMARDAMSRISNELIGAQPTSLPTVAPSATPPPPLTMAKPMEARFNSSYNSSSANADGSGLTALRPTRIWLDTATVPSPPWSDQGRTLYWQRDMNGNGSFTDAGDRSIVLAHNVVNTRVADATNGTSYTPVFRYAYRSAGGDIQWTDNDSSTLDIASVVGLRVRLVIDSNLAHTPDYVDLTTTVRLRNASSN
jgi:prepilin-type N-terminal cleavage/methylation domain-containing protein